MICQSAVGHDWGRSKTANQAFVTTSRRVRLLGSDDEGFEKEEKLRTRLLSQHPSGWGSWQSHDEGFEKEEKLRTRLLYQDFASSLLSIPFREETNWVALVNEVKTRTSLLSQNILGSMWNLPPAGREVLGKKQK